MNMSQPIKATTVAEYLDSVPAERKELIEFLHSFIQKTVPTLKSHLAYNMLSYGSFPYLNYKKQEIEWPTIALANQKNYISIYVCCIAENGQYLAEKYADKLGKVSVGKSCIRFKKKEDINLDILKEVLVKTSQNPGLRPEK